MLLKYLTAEIALAAALSPVCDLKVQQPWKEAVNRVWIDSMINFPKSSSQWEESAEPASFDTSHLAICEDRQPETQRPSGLALDSLSSKGQRLCSPSTLFLHSYTMKIEHLTVGDVMQCTMIKQFLQNK